MRRCLSRWHDHPDFEDLLGEVRVRFWREVATTSRGAWVWSHWRLCIRQHCRETAYWFERCPANSRRRINSSGEKVMQGCSLEHLPDEWEGHSFSLGSDNWLRWVVPDFAPRLLDRMERLETWAGTMDTLDDEEATLVQEWLRGEKTFSGDQTTYTRMHRCLNRYRQRVGAPLKFNGQMGRRGWQAKKEPEREARLTGASSESEK